MARARFRGVLLCEDQEHEMFFCRLLYKRWFARGRLHVEKNTKGAADKFVLARYAREVRHARRKRHENYALVVVVDGDRLKMQKRLRQLDEQLAAEDPAQLGSNENVLIFVPTRNVETWELWLCGERDLDEDQDYKSRYRDAVRQGAASVKAAVDAWFENLSPRDQQVERETMPSLAAGRLEIQRLDQLGG